MPIDHDAAAAVACVPFGQQVLIPGPELLRVRSARCRSFSPYLRRSRPHGGIHDFSDGGAELILIDVAAANVEQVLIVGALLSGAHALDASIRSQPVDGKQKALLKHFPIQVLPQCGAPKYVGEPDAEVGLLEDIEQARHGPPLDHSRFQCAKIRRFGLNGKRREFGSATALLLDLDVFIGGQAFVEARKRLVHLTFQDCDEVLRRRGKRQGESPHRHPVPS